MKKPSWSFSAIKLFEQCPKKYYHLKIKRDFKDEENTAAAYGTEFHDAAEHYVASSVPLPAKFKFAKSALDKLVALPGDKLCEYEMGLTRALEPCDFDHPECWFRGIVDLAIIHETTAKLLDYKAGKSARYADKDQLELMALAIFKHFPTVDTVDAGLFFVVAKAFIPGQYHRKDASKLWVNWLRRYNQIITCIEHDTWNAKTSGLCKQYCVVLSCHHNGRNM